MFQRSNGVMGSEGSQNAPAEAPPPKPLSGNKRRAYMPPPESDEDDSSDSSSSEDSEYVPPPRTRGPGARGEYGGLRAAPTAAPPRYWDHESHMEACRNELADLAREGVTWDDIDASEGDSDCDIESEEDEENNQEENHPPVDDPK